MTGVNIRGKILQWGNSYGIRLTRQEAEDAGLRPGMEMEIRLRPADEPYDVSDLPTFRPVHRPSRGLDGEERDAAAGAWSAFKEKMDRD